mgnify:CR=1 FL=1
MLLNDVRILENIEIISEAKSPQGMKIRGLFQRADEQNNNNRIYPLTVLESQVKGLQDMINENRLCGELDHPSHDIVKLSNASHLITGLYMKGNDVIGEAKVLDTPAGKVAQALIEGGVKIGISSRGVGTLSEDTMRKVKYVNEDYKLVTFDLVADPSTKGAFPTLSESTESSEKTRKIVNDTYKKALGEKVFVTMLKESFDTSLQEADKPYEKEDTSYDNIMKMRGYPSIDDVLKRNKTKEDPFYKAMMAAVTGATTVRAKEAYSVADVRKKGRAQAERARDETTVKDKTVGAPSKQRVAGLVTKAELTHGQHQDAKEDMGSYKVGDPAARVKRTNMQARRAEGAAGDALYARRKAAANMRGVLNWRRDAVAKTKAHHKARVVSNTQPTYGSMTELLKESGRVTNRASRIKEYASTQPTYNRIAEFLGEAVIIHEEAMLMNESSLLTYDRMANILMEAVPGSQEGADMDAEHKARKKARRDADDRYTVGTPGKKGEYHAGAGKPPIHSDDPENMTRRAKAERENPSNLNRRLRSFKRGRTGQELTADEPSTVAHTAGRATAAAGRGARAAASVGKKAVVGTAKGIGTGVGATVRGAWKGIKGTAGGLKKAASWAKDKTGQLGQRIKDSSAARATARDSLMRSPRRRAAARAATAEADRRGRASRTPEANRRRRRTRAEKEAMPGSSATQRAQERDKQQRMGQRDIDQQSAAAKVGTMDPKKVQTPLSSRQRSKMERKPFNPEQPKKRINPTKVAPVTQRPLRQRRLNMSTELVYGRMAELIGESFVLNEKYLEEIKLGAIPQAVGRGAKKVVRGVVRGAKKVVGNVVDKVAKATDPNPKYPTGSQYPHGD